MNRVVKILMERDGLTKQEAENIISEVADMIMECNGDYSEAEDIMYSELGLEMDYILDII